MLHGVVVNMKWNYLCDMAYSKSQNAYLLLLPHVDVVITTCLLLPAFWLLIPWCYNCPSICKVVKTTSLMGPCNWSAPKHCSDGREVVTVMSGLQWPVLCCRLGTSAIVPPPPPAHVFDQRHSFLAPRASSSFGGRAPPIYQGHFEFPLLSFKALTTLSKSVSAFRPSSRWWVPDDSDPREAPSSESAVLSASRWSSPSR